MVNRKTSVVACSTLTILFVFFLWLSIASCSDFLDVDVPNSKITSGVVYSDEATATGSVAGIYLDIYRNGGFASGGRLGLSTFAGLSVDELRNNPHDDPLYLEFERNDIDPNNSYLLGVWTSMYKAIYGANAVLEGLEKSSNLASSLKSQLSGEVLFLRAFAYFYLVNTFGDVPLVVSTDYTANRGLKRLAPAIVYEQIISDLISAEELLSDAYPSPGRVRPNQLTATALLSRVYLYTGDWARAEDKASKLISRTDLYSLLTDLSEVFLQNSAEAVWQLKPPDNAFSTNEGYIFSVLQGPQYNVLKDEMFFAFEANDYRRVNWVTTTMSGGQTVYLPYKYKKFDLVTPTNEYSVVIRLAEMYLIRSEARLRQNKIAGAIQDIDSIRHRAHLPLIHDTNPGISTDDLFQYIVQERRVELMVEWGHRWFDLKRWGTAAIVLGGNKSNLTDSDLLYPIPQKEINNNMNLNPQNDGY